MNQFNRCIAVTLRDALPPMGTALATVVVAAAVDAASPINAGFEAGLSGWDTLGDGSTVTATFGVTPTEGIAQALLTTGPETTGTVGSVADIATIETQLGIAAGSLQALNIGDTGPTEGSAVYQTVTVGRPGDVLTFDWNFLTNEVPAGGDFEDFAFFSVSGQAPIALATALDSALSPSGTAFADETGWATFSFVFPAAGSYTLGFGVVDTDDVIVASGLVIDNLQLTPIPSPAAAGIGSLAVATLALRRERARRRQSGRPRRA